MTLAENVARPAQPLSQQGPCMTRARLVRDAEWARAHSALFVLLWRLRHDERLASGQHDVVEVHAGRARDVQTVHQLEAGDAEGHPGKIGAIAKRKPDGKGAKLGQDPVARVERACDEHLYVEGAEALDAQWLARNLAVAGDPITQALQAEELAIQRPDEDAVQFVDAREMLRLEARGEISRMEVGRLERSLSRRRLLSPEGLHEKSFLPKARILRALARLEGEERAGGSHSELGRRLPHRR